MRAGATIWLCSLAAVGCAPQVQPDPSRGVDLEQVQQCLSCHPTLAARWANPSSHALLFDCGSCHEKKLEQEGPGHRASAECAQCHSATAHQGFACTQCHDPHGSENLFLVPTELGPAANVHLSRPEGATADGLARAGVANQTAGTGPCEVCHLATRYYRASGDGQPHQTAWCAGCHTHAQGFAPP